jgi:hypothetical protein
MNTCARDVMRDERFDWEPPRFFAYLTARTQMVLIEKPHIPTAMGGEREIGAGEMTVDTHTC